MLILCIVFISFGKFMDCQVLPRPGGPAGSSSLYPWLRDALAESKNENTRNYNEMMKTLNMCTMQTAGYKQSSNKNGTSIQIKPNDFYTGITDRLSQMTADSQTQEDMIRNVTKLMEAQMGRIDEIERQNLKTLAALQELLRSVSNIAFGTDPIDTGCAVDDFKCKEDECKKHTGYSFEQDAVISVCLKFVYGFPDINVTKFTESCKTDGANLIKIDGYEKHQVVIKFLETKSFGDPQIIIQGRDDNTEGVWEFDDGSRMTYLPWYSGQPNSYNGEQDHIGMKKSFSNYKWGDIWRKMSGYSSAYICEIEI